MSDFILRDTAGARIRVLPRPIVAPGHCVVCGHTGTNDTGDSQEVLFFDFSFDIEFYGRVYFCTQCMVEMMGDLGFITPTQAEQMRQHNAAQESELIVLRDQNERLRGSLNSLLGGDNNSIPGDDVIPVSSDGDSGQETPIGSETSTGDELPSDGSISEQGSTGVSSDNSSNSNFDGFAL